MGRVQYVTSYSDTSGTTIANQIKYDYDGWGNIYREWQDHSTTGVVDDLFYGSDYVQYDYYDGRYDGDAYYDASAGMYVAKYVRLDDMIYPYKDQTAYIGARTVYYSYFADTIDDVMSRVESITTTGNEAHASYKYLGADQIVTQDYTDIAVKLDYDPAGNNSLTGLDRFGRVRDQFWSDYGSDPSYSDHFTYVYDRAGNRTSRVNALDAAFSETYGYDDLNRLTWAKRNGVDLQSWGLDGAGNMSSVTTSGSPTQTRTTNEVNEITGVTGGWITPTYDSAGNMISGPKPGAETTRVRYVYDAWNRLAAVKADDGTLISAYQYDGVNRRTTKTDVNGSSDNYYYDHNWRMVEDRNAGQYTGTQYVEQYLWNPGGGNSPVVYLHNGANVYGDPPNGDTTDDYPTDWRTYYTTDANGNVTSTIRVEQHQHGDVQRRREPQRLHALRHGDPDRRNWSGDSIEVNFDGPLYCGYFFNVNTGLYQVRPATTTPTWARSFPATRRRAARFSTPTATPTRSGRPIRADWPQATTQRSGGHSRVGMIIWAEWSGTTIALAISI